MINIKNSFASRLRLAMEIRGVRANELSKKADISKASISQYVNGKYEAKQDGVYKIAKALDVSEAWLMGFDAPMERAEDDNKVAREMHVYDDEAIGLMREMYERPELRVLFKTTAKVKAKDIAFVDEFLKRVANEDDDGSNEESF